MRLGIFYGLLAGALWGIVFVVPKLLPDFGPLQVSAGRYIAYGLVSLAVLMPRARSVLSRLRMADVRALFSLSLSGNLVYYILLAAAVRLVGVAPTSLIIGVLPVTITLVGSREHGALPFRRLVAPLATVLAGIVCINLDVFGGTTDGGPQTGAALAGVVCAALALLSWTIFAVGNARYLRSQDRFSSNDWSVLWGLMSGVVGAFVWIFTMLVPAEWHGPLLIANPDAARWHEFVLVNLGLAIGASWLGNALWNAASQRLPLTLSGQMIVFETLFALLYGYVYAGRWPRGLEILAIVLLVGGVLWSVRVHAKAEKPDPLLQAEHP
ncbi:DMT family transporter [Chitinasiproducens palmae]|uniref:Permease of the drug/metabolite transporter (DMT) superfamily n=1 Tax=Chitinasiproducens palmae TaxID=1770053 RepID=A0A1H2PLV7_9BURK|nr:DMT family transporter [Chitinasiproducens palmae]SDV47439.1 Permease of the drug/metabolite transporter (DMT) superfamily [Chitinasiproducens palmae]